MSNEYYDAIDKMEKEGVQREYIIGWASGYTGQPEREEQRVTEAYEAGYADGQEKNADGYGDWKN